MFRKIIFMFSVGVFTTALAAGAMAFGIGGYMTVGGGNTTYDFSKFEYFKTGSMKESSDFAIGAGLVLDTNLAYDRVFNYRLKLGGEQVTADRERELKFGRINMNHVFGFGVVRTKVVRFWFGPSIGGSYSWSNSSSDQKYYLGIAPMNYRYQKIVFPSLPYDPTAFVFGLLRDKVKKIYFGGIDIGLVLGLNINIGSFVTIGPELGFKYAFNWGYQKREVYAGLLPISLGSALNLNINDDNKRITLKGYEIYGNIAVMFRVGGDNYGR
jgi:hypothetical protein